MSPPPRVLPNPSRRLWLGPACLFALHGAAVGALPFDRKAENLRYRQWLVGFSRTCPGCGDWSTRARRTWTACSSRGRWCSDPGHAPGRRAGPGERGRFFGSARDGGIERAFLVALSDAVAGDGGDYPETGSRRPPQPLRVRYMHVDGGGRLERYFNDPEIFKPYRLPAPGVLARDAYPFLLFETREGHLRLGGVSREFWELVRFMDGLSYA